MIERALRILPALNNVLSRYGNPISAMDVFALEKIVTALVPFKRAILLLCRNDATLLIADKTFKLLYQDLQSIESELASMLLSNLRTELGKRRTILSTCLAVLDVPGYDFECEKLFGLPKPSKREIVDVLTEITDAEPTAPTPEADEGTQVRAPGQF